MLTILSGIFIILHGLVHGWYVVLSQKLVAFQPEMGWTGRSWLLTNAIGDGATRTIASILYILSAIGLVAGGIGVMAHAPWQRGVLLASAILSAVSILACWDGSTQMIVQKGLIGFLINIAILVVILL